MLKICIYLHNVDKQPMYHVYWYVEEEVVRQCSRLKVENLGIIIKERARAKRS